MDVKSAAIQVLQQAGTALHAKDIAKRSIDSGLWQSKGKTPSATVSAHIYSDIKKKGSKSSFVKVGASTFALRDSIQEQKNDQTTLAEVGQHQKLLSPNTGLSFTDCAEKVLKKFGDKRPMHYKRITEKALEEGWLITSGKTPENTMYAQVLNDIRRRKKRGDQPRFVRRDLGLLGLAQWMEREFKLSRQIAEHNRKVQKILRERLLTIKPYKFEELIKDLLIRMGFDRVEVTKASGDGGIDVRGTLVIEHVARIKMAVQVKRWNLKNNVQAPVVRDVRGSLRALEERGLIITTSDFSSGAKEEAEEPGKFPIALVNGEQLVELLVEHGREFLKEYDIHVQSSPQELLNITGNLGR